MSDTRNKPSVFAGILPVLLSFWAFYLAIEIAGLRHFRAGKGSNAAVITPESHPIFFWCWVAFIFGVGLVLLIRGVVALRVFLRSRR